MFYSITCHILKQHNLKGKLAVNRNVAVGQK